MAGCSDERAGDGMDEVKRLTEPTVVVAFKLDEGVTGRHSECPEDQVCHNT